MYPMAILSLIPEKNIPTAPRNKALEKVPIRYLSKGNVLPLTFIKTTKQRIMTNIVTTAVNVRTK